MQRSVREAGVCVCVCVCVCERERESERGSEGERDGTLISERFLQLTSMKILN